MANLQTEYMGIPVNNPLVAAASSLSSHIDTIRRVADLGAGALVIKSLFEEQIRHESGTLETMLSLGDVSAESTSFFPQLPPDGARNHLLWVERAREAIEMPLIASLNAVSTSGWVDYARKLAETGVDGLELNVYAVEADLDRRSEEIEKRLIDNVAAVRAQTQLPLAVKIGPWFTSTANLVARLETAGANAVVLFNRFFQPDIDPERQELFNRMTWSRAEDMRLPLRWIALLYGRVGLDLFANTGVQEAADIAKYILAGAKAVQVAGVLYRRKLTVIPELLEGLQNWMDAKGYADLDAFRGKLSQAHHPAHPAVYERAQYFDFLRQANNERVGADDE